MKRKSVKGKVIAGVVAVGLVSGFGVAAANTDIGGKLQSWYDGQFGAAKASMVDDVGGHVAGKFNSLEKEYNNGKEATKNAINSERDSKISGATTSISDTKDQYLADLENRQATIEGQIESQFAGLFAEAKGLIDGAGAVAYNYAKDDFTKLTGKTGTAALGQVETEINAAKDSAVSELEAAIAQAKQELQAQLDSEEAATTQEIKDAIDYKINELRGKLGTLVSGLIKTQKGLIAKKADELEAQAIAALDQAADFK
ncbi:hypothetical protein [Bacillus sp. 1P02SD]|uniref:hypothetical protein n=1 Tax=Bacillus sp. 1P02SD TaxID=3132264 RepID=UPI0039A2B54E